MSSDLRADLPTPQVAPGLVIGVLMASHNRRSATLACLHSLSAQVDAGAKVEVHLVDDASTDGTVDAVQREFPAVQVTLGSGHLYWAGAMHLAEQRALRSAPDYLLWLNDDVVLAPDALARLLAAHEERTTAGHLPGVVVGATRNSSGATTYGGVERASGYRRMRFSLIEPDDLPQRCSTMNGNVALIPASVVERAGGIDPRFRHGLADFDFGLRVTKSRIPVWLAPGWVGVCEQNPVEGTFKDSALPMAERARHLVSKKGVPPREWLRFTWRYAGPAWPVYFASPYLRFMVGLWGHRVGAWRSAVHRRSRGRV